MSDFPNSPASDTPAAANELSQALAERTALIHEIDHRVKNNLQLISSLILLQTRRASDDCERRALKTVLERIAAIATVHRRLFQGDPQWFEVADFIGDLTADVAGAAGREDVEILLDLEPISIPAASAAAFALIYNELLCNALKHAFPDSRPGRIDVSLVRRGGACVLTVADDGVGRGVGPDGFGMTIVELLCKQLHATRETADGRPGLHTTLSVPVSRSAPR